MLHGQKKIIIQECVDNNFPQKNLLQAGEPINYQTDMFDLCEILWSMAWASGINGMILQSS